MRGSIDRLVRPETIAVTLAVALVAAAALLLPALRDERRLSDATKDLSSDPSRALALSSRAVRATTGPRVRAVQTAALVRLGRLREAEQAARADLGRDPTDVYAARRLYEIQMLRKEHGAARATRRILRRLDPRFVAGDGV
jgi:hypothetical protein